MKIQDINKEIQLNREILNSVKNSKNEQSELIKIACDFLHYLFLYVDKKTEQKQYIDDLDYLEVKFLYWRDPIINPNSYIDSNKKCVQVCNIIKKQFCDIVKQLNIA